MTDTSEKIIDWSLKGHLPKCQFHFAPLDVCDCTQRRMQARITGLERELGHCIYELNRADSRKPHRDRRAGLARAVLKGEDK